MNIWIGRLKDFFRYKDLLKHLISRDVKLKYRRSILGYLWSVLDPLFIMIIMSIVFSKMFDRNIENYPVYLFAGNLIFSFMRTSSTKALDSINNNATLIKKAYIPKYIFTLSKVCSCLIDLLFTMAALFIVMLVTGADFSWYNLLFPFVLIQLFVFCLGLGLFLAQANVFFKDVQYIYNAVITAWMYVSAIFYPIEAIPDKLRYLIEHFNPIYYYIKQFRDVLYEGAMPDTFYIAAGCIAAVVMLIIGTWSFIKSQDKFILYI